MAFYRATFPKALITVKMHMLEDHVADRIGEHGVGFKLMVEQGAESIHSKFNSYRRTFASVPDGVAQLKSIMKEHFLNISPSMCLLGLPHC